MDPTSPWPEAPIRPTLILLLLGGAFTCSPPGDQESFPVGDSEWIQLFNGRDLTGWNMKIRGQDLGVDPWETVRVQDGLLTVGYENYDGWQDRFGHLFYQEPFSHYQIRVEYRFVGEQVSGAPAWAFKNNGIMLHSQPPETMLKDQSFPLSIEAQLLGGNGRDDRPTANVCTPGTHVSIDGEQVRDHCITADAPTIHGEEWVTLDLVVRGASSVVHIMDGDTVMAYTDLVIGGATAEEFGEPASNEGQPLAGGYIAIQSESHPIQFRTIRLRPLPEGNDIGGDQ